MTTRSLRRPLLALVTAMAIAIAVTVAAVLWQRPAEIPAANRPPNIIHIMVDDLGYGDLGAYGQQHIATPHIDQLAAEGMRFTRHYAGSSVCAPSRDAHLTGMHTGHSGAINNGLLVLQPDRLTVAEVLQSGGYTTAAIGKWAQGGRTTPGYPTKQGFDYWFGYQSQPDAHNFYPEVLYRMHRAVKLDNELSANERNISSRKQVWAPDLLIEEALEFIHDHRRQPFYLQFFPNLPHTNSELQVKTGNGFEVPHTRNYDDRDWTAAEKSFAQMLTILDQQVGRIVSTLSAEGLADRTIIFITSDNGAAGERTRASLQKFAAAGGLAGEKGTFLEGGIRVPLVVWWPGHIAAGSTNKHISAGWDFLPTAAELAGLEIPAGIDGISYAPSLLGKEGQAEHPYLFWELKGDLAILAGDWKLVLLTNPWQPRVRMHNLKNDPGEQVNLANKPRLAAKRTELQQLIDQLQASPDYWKNR